MALVDIEVEDENAPASEPAAASPFPAETPGKTSSSSPTWSSKGVKASPAALHHARKLNYDLSKIIGTGKHGIVTKPDVLSHQPTGGKVISTPDVRKFAKDNNIDIGKVMGSGPNGRVLKSDV